MRITFVVPVLEVSGGARIIAGHAERLAKRGHDVLVVAPRPARASLKEKAKAVLGIGMRAFRAEQSLIALADVPLHIPSRDRAPIEEFDVPDADVIIATWWETAEWIWPFAANKGAKVHFIQGYEAVPELPAPERVDAVWRLPTFKIAIAQWLVDLGRERFGIEEMALVPNSIDHELFKAPTTRLKGEPPTIGFLFHEAAFKDMPITVAAVARLRERVPDAQLVSFGTSLPRVGELPPGTEFHHLPSQGEIAQIYGRCDAWLSTSRREGFNLPPLEAMACGTPAVCGKTGRPLEIIENAVNGYLVEPGDVGGFADALAAILSLSEQDWNEMSKAAVRAAAHPTWEQSTDLFERALMQSLAVANQGTA